MTFRGYHHGRRLLHPSAHGLSARTSPSLSARPPRTRETDLVWPPSGPRSRTWTRPVYGSDPGRVRARISRSVRHALDQPPPHYAHLPRRQPLPRPCAASSTSTPTRWWWTTSRTPGAVDLGPRHVVAAPEYCHANFTKYLTDAFWADPARPAAAFRNKVPCYFNTGVMVMDVARWRQGGFTSRVEEWMAVQKRRRIYHLGSLPPFLLVLAGDIKPVDHRWNQHGLGGDNVEGRCRSLHPGPISLLHWSGKGNRG
ncbi:hypothetical protein PR202_gb21862 [Eleusine coracana subsp. coracana]|uniref:Hexosyltransferase n=1 Tax=Eleusine coracana subsp. coracana TaxID=191504 RepID=A0AAV5FEA5_ELECO|nr:hypothetical protein PR202_gb21862 [Eleusine coracana subsp. coracana]